MQIIKQYQCVALALMAGACSTTSTFKTDTLATMSSGVSMSAISSSDIICQNSDAALSANFSAARLSDCFVEPDGNLTVVIRPENTPINDSAWYSFRVDPKSDNPIKINLTYEDGKHRYSPKKSYDGRNWIHLPDKAMKSAEDGGIALDLKGDSQPYLISGQEVLTTQEHDDWTRGLSSLPFVTESVIGTSIDGHPIKLLTVQTDPDAKKPFVMLTGRQHPPEVTGALALIPFAETVLSDSPLATAFREKYNILIVPNMNPDGVTAGNWRHNKGGLDLNRDWGPFTQPETQAVKSALKRFETGEDSIILFLDFHSTWRNLLYTQADDEPTSPRFFTRDWLRNVDAALNDNIYSFTREANHNNGRPTSKNYMFEQFGIAAITYEVGDNTDRKAITISATIFAEEMMKQLLSYQNPEITN